MNGTVEKEVRDGHDGDGAGGADGVPHDGVRERGSLGHVATIGGESPIGPGWVSRSETPGGFGVGRDRRGDHAAAGGGYTENS